MNARQTPTRSALPTPSASPARRRLIGWLLAVGLAVLAYRIQHLPFPPFRVEDETGARYPVGAAMIAIVLGVVVSNAATLPRAIREGARHLARVGIPITIVLIGAGLNLTIVVEIGAPALLVVATGIAVAFGAAWLLGAALGLRRSTSTLIGAGTAICGNSAVLAVAPVVRADEEDVVLAIGTINLFGLLAMLALPLLGALMALGPEAFGIWAGSSIHAVPQSVAAGFAHGSGSGEVATLVKLVRVTLLAPLVLVIGLVYAAGRRRAEGQARGTLLPWFIWGFFGLAVANTVAGGGAAAGEILTFLNRTGAILLTVCMAALGLEMDLRHLTRVGGRVLLAGLLATVVLVTTSLGLIFLLV